MSMVRFQSGAGEGGAISECDHGAVQFIGLSAPQKTSSAALFEKVFHYIFFIELSRTSTLKAIFAELRYVLKSAIWSK